MSIVFRQYAQEAHWITSTPQVLLQKQHHSLSRKQDLKAKLASFYRNFPPLHVQELFNRQVIKSPDN